MSVMLSTKHNQVQLTLLAFAQVWQNIGAMKIWLAAASQAHSLGQDTKKDIIHKLIRRH